MLLVCHAEVKVRNSQSFRPTACHPVTRQASMCTANQSQPSHILPLLSVPHPSAHQSPSEISEASEALTYQHQNIVKNMIGALSCAH